jgi:NAD(P)-dependent dehydrogenase (short-subunit alcohol dehydrogenase family)
MHIKKIVMVTGGTRGIGYCIAAEFAKKGDRVIIIGKDFQRGARAQEEINRNHGECYFIEADLSKKEEVERVFNYITAQYTAIDIAVNNAGIEGASFTLIHQYPEEIFDEVIDINLKSMWRCLKYQIPLMLKNSLGGKIINIASVAGLRASLTGGTAYTASKHGVIGLTKAISREYASKNIRVNAICPGLVATEEVKELIEIGKIKNIKNIHPIGRLIEPIEIANAVIWLSSKESDAITGIALPIDGGALA